MPRYLSASKVINWRSLKPSVAVHRLVKGGGVITSVQSAEVMAANGIGAVRFKDRSRPLRTYSQKQKIKMPLVSLHSQRPPEHDDRAKRIGAGILGACIEVGKLGKGTVLRVQL